MHLGESGTEQFVVTTTQDGKLIHEQRIHDPFICSTTTIAISRWDLFKAMFRRQYKTKICVRVTGSLGAQRAIMTMDPFALELETLKMAEEHALGRSSYVSSANVVNAG
jgi:hypothetical protein